MVFCKSCWRFKPKKALDTSKPKALNQGVEFRAQGLGLPVEGLGTRAKAPQTYTFVPTSKPL